MASLGKVLFRYLSGNRKTAVFAITTCCNCKCKMCGMHKKKPEFISLKDAKRVLDFFDKNKFLIVYFTGGEPSLHPHLIEIMEYANNLGFAISITSNGTISEDQLMEAKQAGLNTLSISLDHWDAKTCEDIRNHKGIHAKAVAALKYAKSIGIKAYALTYLNPVLVATNGVRKMINYVNNEIGVAWGFCYPTVTEASSFDLKCEYSKEELKKNIKKTIQTIIDMKEEGSNIANLYTYLEDLKNMDSKSKNFYCKSGEDVVYVDWKADVYPCFMLPKMFNILKDKNPKFYKNFTCDKCYINCFREPSIISQISMRNIAKEIKYFFKSGNVFV